MRSRGDRAFARRLALGARLRTDRGIALPMVLMVFLVGFAIVSAFIVAIVGSSQVTAATKASVQAQAAAEAGIADALSRLDEGDVCALFAETITSDTPDYDVERFVGSDGNWLADEGDCAPGSGPQLKLVSTGWAGDTQAKVERIYGVAGGGVGGSTALRTADGLVLNGDAHMDTIDVDSPADVYVENGNLDCGASGRIQGSVYVANGTARISGACPITGDLVAKGNIEFTGSGRVDGSVVSVDGTVTLSGDARIGGNVYTKLDFNRTNGRVDGNVYAGRNASVSGGAPAIMGTLQYGNTFTKAWGSDSDWVKGGAPLKTDTSGVPRPELPELPMWNALTLADIKAGGFTEQTWGGSCTVAGGTAHPYFSTTIPTYTSKTVINALGCDILRTQSGVDLKISTDLVIVGKRIQLNNVRISSADGQPHTIWFVVPTEQACPTGNSPAIEMQNTVRFPDGKISALAYAKCPIVFQNAGNDPWPGSIYAKSMSGYLAIDYHPVALPGATGGGGGGGGSKLTLVGTRDNPLSHRNVG